MQLHRPFATVTSTVDGDVLTVLASADSAFSTSQLLRLMSSRSYSGTRRALLRLVEQGVVLSEDVGNVHSYRLNRDHVAADAVIELAHLRSRVLERLRREFESWTHKPEFASLFGSAVRGQMRPTSDLDIFVVRPSAVEVSTDGRLDVWVGDLTNLEVRAASWTGNDVRVLELGEKEVRAGLAASDPTLESIRTEGLVLHGPVNFWKVRRG